MIDPDTHKLLVDWACWCRSKHTPTEFHVLCQSAESKHLPEAGEVMMTLEERLKSSKPNYDSLQAERVEDVIRCLPDKPKLALRLHYVVWRSMPIKQKRRLLGVSEDGYWELLENAALLTSQRLGDTNAARPLLNWENFP